MLALRDPFSDTGVRHISGRTAGIQEGVREKTDLSRFMLEWALMHASSREGFNECKDVASNDKETIQ